MKIDISHYKDLIKLGLPIMVGQLGIIVQSMADTMMVGHYGTEELAASAFVNNIFNLVIFFAIGFSYGITPLVGNLYGKGEKGSVGAVLKNAIAISSLLGLVIFLLLGVLYFNIHRLGQPEILLPLIRPYFLIVLLSMFPMLIFNAFRQTLEGTTDTFTPMIILLGSNVLNIVGNWVLIYGHLGMPELGLVGAGISTLVSRLAMLAAICAFFLKSKKCQEYRKGFRATSVNPEECRNIARLGMPVAVQMGLETSSFSLTAIMVGWIGTVALAAHQIMLTVGQLGFLMYYGMAAAVAVRASNFAGKNMIPEVRMTVSAGYRMILAMSAVVTACIIVFRNHIGMLFSDNQEVVTLVSHLVLPFVLYQFGDGLQCNYSNALRGISDVKMVSAYAFIAYFLIGLPAGYILAFVFNLGIYGIWMSFMLGLTAAGTMFLVRYKKSVRKLSHGLV